MVGLAADSGVFKRAVKAPQFTEEELAKPSKFNRPFILGKMNSRSTAEYNEGLLELPAAEAHERFGDSWIPVRRFAVQQKGKMRPIDDFSENQVNEAWGCCEALCWTVAAFVKHCVFERTVHFRLRDGGELRGPVHDGWAKDDSAVLLTTVDLKSAYYKQLPVFPGHQKFAVVSLRDDGARQRVHYVMNTLPFGAAAVHHFNRVSRLLWAVGTKSLLVPWANYFNDFPVISSQTSTSTLGSIKTMLKILGCEYAEDKLEPFPESERLRCWAWSLAYLGHVTARLLSRINLEGIWRWLPWRLIC